MKIKNILKKENITPVAVLLVICVVVAALLGAINMLTREKIADNEQQKVFASLKEAMDGHITPIDTPKDAPKSVTGIYEVRESADSDTLKGKIVTVVVKGYAGDISMTVGVKSDGTVSKVVITSQSESHGKAGMSNYPDKFSGVSADAVGEVDLFTGATVSSTAIRGGVVDAVAAAMGTGSSDESEEPEALPKTDEEILDLAETLVGEGTTFTDVTPEDGELLKRLYKASGNKGYVAYLLVISATYGTPETETLVHFSNAGKIVAVNKLTWKASDAIPGLYEPPTEETVNEFYAKLAGNTSASFAEKFVKAEGEDKEVEHVSGATNTTNNLVASISEAFAEVDELIRLDMPREEAKVVELAGALVGEGASLTDITPDDSTLVKRLYKVADGGYVAYLVVISSNYGTVETETLVHFDKAGKIVAVNKLIWKTSDAIPGLYEPPTEETVNEFYAKLAGNTSASFAEKFVKAEGEDKEVEHVANATNTTNNLVASISEAFGYVDALVESNASENYGARITGIIILSVAILCPVALVVYKKIKRREKV